jgi:hypothetical protein
LIPLGDAPEQFDEREAEVWEKFKTEVNWLMESDRATVEVATRLRVRVLLNQYTEGDISRLLSCLSKMGATPADRTKVFVPDAGKDDEASEFFN